MFDKNMETEAIPERVFALCQFLVAGAKKESEIRDIVETRCSDVENFLL